MEAFQVHDEGIPDGGQLGGDDRQDRHVYTVELIKAPPGSTLTQT